MLKRTNRLVLLVPLCVVLAASASASERADKPRQEEQKVIDFLVNDWGKDYSVTSVDIAMDALKVKQSDNTRFRIGSYIKAHPELHEVIRRWGWVTLVLTPDEKLIARALINAERDGRRAPTVGEIAKAVEIKEDKVRRGLVMLAKYEILKRDGSAGGAGYRVVPRYIKWEPRLDFLFHKVTLESGRQFNTN